MSALHRFVILSLLLLFSRCTAEGIFQTCIWFEESGSIYAYFSDLSYYVVEDNIQNISQKNIIRSFIFLSKNDITNNTSTLKSISVSDVLWLNSLRSEQNTSDDRNVLFQTSGFVPFYLSDKKGSIAYSQKKEHFVFFMLADSWLRDPQSWIARLIFAEVSKSDNVDSIKNIFDGVNIIKEITLEIQPEWVIVDDGVNLQTQYFCF